MSPINYSADLIKLNGKREISPGKELGMDRILNLISGWIPYDLPNIWADTGDPALDI